MVTIKSWWNAFKTVAILFSFIINFIFLVVLLFLVLLIFQIKNGIAEPLIVGPSTARMGTPLREEGRKGEPVRVYR